MFYSSVMDGACLAPCLFDNITDFLRKMKCTGPNLSRSSEEFDILPPWKLLLEVETTGINVRIEVYETG